MKSYSDTKIADIFLGGLYDAERKGSPMPFINEILSKENIYYTPKICERVFQLLKDQQLIEPIPNKFSTFAYKDRIGEVVVPSFDEDTIDDIIPLYRLTSEGRYFAAAGQKLDTTKENFVEIIWIQIKQNKVAASFIVAASIVTAFIALYEKVAPYAPILNWNKTELTTLPPPLKTAWIFAGYFSEKDSAFVMGPYFEVVETRHKERFIFPKVGDFIKIIEKDRDLLIPDYRTKGLTLELQPPWMQGIIDNDDLTGIKLQIGSNVQVMAVSAGKYPDSEEAAVYIRIRGNN